MSDRSWRRCFAVPGSDYGRGHVTEYMGDLMSLEDLYQSTVQMAALASRTIFTIDPNSTADPAEFAAASSGDVILGREEDFGTLGLNKSQDFGFVVTVADKTEDRVNRAFLVQNFRNAERVTAEEIRASSEELENTLGGTFSLLASELQKPIATRYLYIAAQQRRMPRLVLDDMGRVVDLEQVITDSYVIALYFPTPALLMEFDLCFDEPSGLTSDDYERLETYLSENQVQQTLDAINARLAWLHRRPADAARLWRGDRRGPGSRGCEGSRSPLLMRTSLRPRGVGSSPDGRSRALSCGREHQRRHASSASLLPRWYRNRQDGRAGSPVHEPEDHPAPRRNPRFRG